MPEFRNYTPKRRDIKTKVTSYGDHKANLRIDFIKRCGYCGCTDSWKVTYYEVDHFIPKDILTIKEKTDYSNLVYSCRSCNNSKRKKWPTNDEIIPNANNEGWVDPCEDSYNLHFSRGTDGTVKYESDLGKWMFHSLKLYKPQHKVIFNIEQLEKLIYEMRELNERTKNPLIEKFLLTTYMKFHDYINQFKEL